MTPPFTVIGTSHFQRAFDKLSRHHPTMAAAYGRVISILEADPYNYSRSHDIKKLEGIPKGYGQYRIRAGRFRFRYDIEGEIVYLKVCSLRREDTYR